MQKTLMLIAAMSLAAHCRAENAVVGSGTPASCTTAAYNSAIALVINDNQGGALTFNCGPNPHVIAVGPKTLANSISIDGGGKITLDAQDLSRIFTVSLDGPDGRTEVTLSNIDLNRGNTAGEQFGGAILVNAFTQLTLNRVSIRNSLASVSGGAIATFANAVLTISDSQFVSNIAANGGAIATRAVVSITRSSFTNNVASGGEGGAIQSYTQDLTIGAGTFRGNGARFGGAIFKRDQRLRVTESDFLNNTSSNDGGAIYVSAGAAEAQVAATYFYDNSATGSGGAIYSGAALGLNFSTVGRNAAQSGGGIHLESAYLSMFGTTLHNNRAQVRGGGVFIRAVTSSFPILFQFVTASGNSAGNINGWGGDIAITSSAPADAQVYRSTLMNGASSEGASIDVDGQVNLVIASSLIWARSGPACTRNASATVASAGNNIAPVACGLALTGDALATTYGQFRLSSFGSYGGGNHSFLPLPGSPAIDRFNDTFFSVDGRLQPTPIDGDGNGTVLADAGAVERQVFEDVIFLDGLE